MGPRRHSLLLYQKNEVTREASDAFQAFSQKQDHEQAARAPKKSRRPRKRQPADRGNRHHPRQIPLRFGRAGGGGPGLSSDASGWTTIGAGFGSRRAGPHGHFESRHPSDGGTAYRTSSSSSTELSRSVPEKRFRDGGPTQGCFPRGHVFGLKPAIPRRFLRRPGPMREPRVTRGSRSLRFAPMNTVRPDHGCRAQPPTRGTDRHFVHVVADRPTARPISFLRGITVPIAW